MSINSIPWIEATHKTPKLKEWYVKPIDMLCNNWAYILNDEGVEVLFVRDDGLVFDSMNFDNEETAKYGLKENGFFKFYLDKEAKKYISSPKKIVDLNNREKTYSSGKYWVGNLPTGKRSLFQIAKRFLKIIK